MDADEPDSLAFHEMGLDDRILKAISKLGWSSPTPIQEKAIPLALEGKDILSRARTGSGKTAAFSIPVIQKILSAKKTATEQCVRALVLTPTKELCSQVHRNLKELTCCCSREVKCVDVSLQIPLSNQRPMLMEKPDIVVGTPSRLLAHIQAGNLSVKDSMEQLIIDEADLVFSFGYEQDIKQLLGHLPKIYQAFLMSATLSSDVKSLKKMVLHNAVILKLEESQLPASSQLTQYHIKCEEDDKFALLCALIKLHLIRGKTLLFVKSVDRCYKLKLFLQQFGVAACVLNSELPVKSRCHIVGQYNEGLYDYVIASDENMLLAPESKKKKERYEKGKPRLKEKEYGTSRGIDFQNVSNVINFDFPKTVDAYIHRVGRTARGDNQGTALSFINMKEMRILEEVENTLSDGNADGESIFKPYNFRMEEIEGFKYRSKDAMKAVTRVAIREARLKEIKQELLNSEKLKSHFEDNPRDYQLLRHDKSLHTVKNPQHLKHVPDYIIPDTLKTMSKERHHFEDKEKKNEKQTTAPQHRNRGARSKRKRPGDPLKTFEYSGLFGPKKSKAKLSFRK